MLQFAALLHISLVYLKKKKKVWYKSEQNLYRDSDFEPETALEKKTTSQHSGLELVMGLGPSSCTISESRPFTCSHGHPPPEPAQKLSFSADSLGDKSQEAQLSVTEVEERCMPIL